MTNNEFEEAVTTQKEILIKSFSSIAFLGNEWLDCTACKNTMTLKLAMIIHDALKSFPDKKKIQELADICNLPADNIKIVLSGLSTDNICDINEAIHQFCVLKYINRESENDKE